MKKEKKTTTIRLTLKATGLIDKIAEHFGVTKTAVMEMAVRKLAEKEHIS